MVVTSPSLNLDENLCKGHRGLSWNISELFLWGEKQKEKATPPRTSCDLQSLWRADGLHVFLPFVINAGLNETVKNYSLDTPEAEKRDTVLEGSMAPTMK